MKIKRHSDFIVETFVLKDFEKVSDYLSAKGFVFENDLWNCNKSVIIENKYRQLLVKDGKLIVKFGKIIGKFTFSGGGTETKLTSVIGLPTYSKTLDVSYNEITSLEGIGDFDNLDAANNMITSLKGLPKNIEGSLDLQDNDLKTLKGGPDTIGSYFDVSENDLTDLQGAPLVETSFYVHGNMLKTLFGLKRIDRSISIVDAGEDVPKEEVSFANSKMTSIGYVVKDYVLELVEYVVAEFGPNNVANLNLPEEYLSTLPDDIRNIYTSAKGLKKFNM